MRMRNRFLIRSYFFDFPETLKTRRSCIEGNNALFAVKQLTEISEQIEKTITQFEEMLGFFDDSAYAKRCC
jgi:hypothetical protein